MLDIKEAKAGDHVWVLTYHGPKQATYRMAWNNGKVLVETLEVPELVENLNCFADRAACYTAAITRKNKEALKALEEVEKYSEEAQKVVPFLDKYESAGRTI